MILHNDARHQIYMMPD